MTARTVVLDVADVTVRFGGVTANDAVSLDVGEGEIAALIGPNGAGKTTLFDVITGARRPDAGTVRFGGTEVTGITRMQRARMGMARTFQNLSLVAGLTPAENVGVGLGRFRRAGILASVLQLPRARGQDRWIRQKAAQALAFVGLPAGAASATAGLPYGDRRRIELARALALGPRLLLLDEPSAGMDPSETAEIASVIRRARDDLGTTVLVVEHDMSFVRSLAERTTVLDFGRVIATGPTADVLDDPAVVEAYLGKRGAVA